MTKLTDTQLIILGKACERPDGAVYPLTTTKLNGGAVTKVLSSLIGKGLLKEARAKRDETVWRHDEKYGRMTLRATPAAYLALGIDERDEPAAVEAETPPTKATAKRARTAKAAPAKDDKPARTRDGTKQAQLIAMLKSPKGATIDEIVAAFAWQPHTARGVLAGALKKKLGLEVTSEKVADRGRVYRLPE